MHHSSSYKDLGVIEKLWGIIPEVTGQFALLHLLAFVTLLISQNLIKRIKYLISAVS